MQTWMLKRVSTSIRLKSPLPRFLDVFDCDADI